MFETVYDFLKVFVTGNQLALPSGEVVSHNKKHLMYVNYIPQCYRCRFLTAAILCLVVLFNSSVNNSRKLSHSCYCFSSCSTNQEEVLQTGVMRPSIVSQWAALSCTNKVKVKSLQHVTGLV